jgi:phosphate transport system substrate-binding protein
MKKVAWLAAVVVGLMAAVGMAQADNITIDAAGATFPYPIYSQWAHKYNSMTGVKLNYQSIGSGGGIAQIKAKTVTFGASDMPLKPEDLDTDGLTQFPTVIGGVVPVVNIEGINAGDITLDGQTLADIFEGKITKWNDPAIAKLNPDADLPDQAIAVVHRSDGSGTSFIYTTYLSQVSPSWADDVGAATSVEWPTGIGAKGNEGVAGNVSQASGSIGYVEYAYAKQNGLAYVKLINHDGNAVAPTAEAFQAAAAGADWSTAPGFYLLLTDQPGAQSWPIAGATFILVYKDPSDPAATKQALQFFDWAYANGDDMAMDLDYVPLPANVVDTIKASWKSNIEASAVP